MKIILKSALYIMCLSRITPNLTKARWNELDCKINDLIGPLHWRISQKETPSNIAADELGGILTNFLKTEPEFVEVEKEYFERKETKTLEEVRILKRDLKKKAKNRNATAEDKANWLKAVKLHAFLLRKEKEKQESSQIKRQEDLYRKNFFKFAKDSCNGTLFAPKVTPTFSKEEADTYFKAKYSTPVRIDTSKLDWMLPTLPPSISYDTSAIRPSQVKAILKAKSPNTAPGEDGLLYGVLAKLPSVQHILATLYTRTNESCLAPASWASSTVVLAHKAGDTADPAMFRMIALTSSLGKIYHQIKADRMAAFMTKNKYIDEATQKAFIRGINGCVEHVQVLSEIIQDAKHKRKTVHFSWFDLTDAYGSIPHQLILLNLKHYHVPESEIAYIEHLYSQLRGFILTKEWKSDPFPFLQKHLHWVQLPHHLQHHIPTAHWLHHKQEGECWVQLGFQGEC